MPRARNSGKRFRFEDRAEIRAWFNYQTKCKRKGIKPMNQSDWIVQHRKIPNINLENVRKKK